MPDNRELTAPLFQPISIGKLTVPNRTVMAPMGRLFAEDGVQPPEAASYYSRRAAGEVGLIICEATGVDHPMSQDSGVVPRMHGDAALASWKRVVDAVHAVGGKVVPQLFHQGMLRGGVASDGTLDSARPSGTIGTPGSTSFAPDFIEKALTPTRPMTDSEIQDVIDGFARSAANAAALGFDGIAIHGAHGYLIDGFLWNESNSRSDRFGGDQRQRTTFAVEVIKAVRSAIGSDLPIIFRFSQHKSHNYDARLVERPEDLEAIVGPIVDAGVDALDTSIRRFWQPAFDGSPLSLAGWTKKLAGNIPVITVGSVGLNNTASETFLKQEGGEVDNIPDLMERFNAGEFDMVAIGRSLIGDPDYVRKLRTGEPPIPFTRAQLMSMA